MRILPTVIPAAAFCLIASSASAQLYPQNSPMAYQQQFMQQQRQQAAYQQMQGIANEQGYLAQQGRIMPPIQQYNASVLTPAQELQQDLQ